MVTIWLFNWLRFHLDFFFIYDTFSFHLLGPYAYCPNTRIVLNMRIVQILVWYGACVLSKYSYDTEHVYCLNTRMVRSMMTWRVKSRSIGHRASYIVTNMSSGTVCIYMSFAFLCCWVSAALMVILYFLSFLSTIFWKNMLNLIYNLYIRKTM